MDVASGLREAHARLTAPEAPERGRAWAHAWSDELDIALETLFRDAGTYTGRLAVVAVGGYGRREVCPGSDVDLLLLTEHMTEDAVAHTVRAIIYPLWDAGLTVGYATRDPGEAVGLASDDVDVATATVDARAVAGDHALAAAVRDRVLEALQNKPWRFLSRLTQADAERRDRYGDAAEVLEPNLKEGAGSLRDVQSLRWAAAALIGEPTLDALVTTRYLAAADRARLARAYDELLAVRVALHRTAERKEDTLTFDRQEAVADALDIDGRGEDGNGATQLLRRVFLAARSIDHIHRSAWAPLAADAKRERSARRWLRRPSAETVRGGFTLADGVLSLGEARVSAADFPTRLLTALAETDAALDRDSAARIRDFVDAAGEDVARETWPWTPSTRREFLDVLWRGSSVLDALAEVDDLGLLAVLVPEWAPLRGRPQRNPYHRYSLDRHALHAATALGDMVREEVWAAGRLQDVEDHDALMLGVLLHDVGKVHGEPHAQTGAPIARAVAERLGLDDEAAATVERLTRLHLLLPETATRRDLADDALIGAVADEVDSRSLLAALHLLAAADGLATGPAAWNNWKAQLVAQLVERVDNVLAAEDGGAGVEDLAAQTAHEAQRLAPSLGLEPGEVSAHLAHLPSRYAASVSARTIVRHTALTRTEVEWSEVRTRVTPGEHPEAGIDDLDVVARDRPGLFAKVAGVISLHGGSILSAYAFIRDDGVVVDTFHVRRPAETVDESGRRPGAWWATVEGDLVEAVAGRLALRARVARRQASRRQPRRTGPEVPVTVELGRDSAGRSSVLEIHAPDDVGLLHRLLSAVAELELDIVAAKIDTVGHEAVDVLYVRDASGAPLDEDHAGEVVLAVEHALVVAPLLP